MGNEIIGYYCKKKKTLLYDFNQTIELMKNEQKHIEIITDSLQNELILEYENIIPEIPYFKGYRQRMFNNMLIITSQVLAVYKVFKKYDKKPDEVWEICHTALLLRLQQIPSRKKWLMNKMWNTLIRAVMMRRALRNVKETLGNFELEYIKGNKEGYDYGINYTKCGHHKFLREHKAEEILPYVCLADISLSDAFGWGLTRTQTIGDGCTHCDFRFKKGAATKITSKKREVQKIIDKLTFQSLILRFHKKNQKPTYDINAINTSHVETCNLLVRRSQA
jgi:hypothetical protein